MGHMLAINATFPLIQLFLYPIGHTSGCNDQKTSGYALGFFGHYYSSVNSKPNVRFPRDTQKHYFPIFENLKLVKVWWLLSQKGTQ